jgi:hypothetical protein
VFRTPHLSQRLSQSASPAALLVAVLALVVAATGAGYAAATIGTNDIKDDAVTSAKVKDGSLKAADLVKESKYKAVTAAGAPNFSDGGQGDCLWQDGATELPGIAKTGFRKDRFGTVHLSGIPFVADGAGGDANCDSAGEPEDGIIFKLPKDYRPAKTQLLVAGTAGLIVITGKALVSPGTFVPAGSVYVAGLSGGGVPLDGITYETKSANVFARTTTSSKVSPQGRELLRSFGLR